jgi:hypothetical protein
VVQVVEAVRYNPVVRCSISYGVIAVHHLRNSSGRTIALGRISNSDDIATVISAAFPQQWATQ